MKPGQIFDAIKLAPQVLAVIDAIRLAAKDKELSPAEVQSIGAALVALVGAIVGVVRK